MKQMKFFLVALMTLVMGMSVTSCMKGEETTIRQLPTIAKCVSTYPPTFNNGYQKLVINDASLITLNAGEVYSFWYEYDSAEQADNAATLNVKLYGGSTPTSINATSMEGPANISGGLEANAPLYMFNSDNSTAPVVMFEQEYLIIPIVYWLKAESTQEDQKKEFDKHSFILTYDEAAITAETSDLVLTINHVINTVGEENVVRDRYTSTYKAYKLSSALYTFENKAGKKPTRIIVKAKVNPSKNSLEGASEASAWNYTIK